MHSEVRTTPRAPAASQLVQGLRLFDATTIVMKFTWPGLIIVLSGVPVYFFWRRKGAGVYGAT